MSCLSVHQNIREFLSAMVSKHPVLKVQTYEQSELGNLKEKAIPIAAAANELETPIYRSALSPTALVKSFPGITTIQEVFENSVKHFGHLPYLGTRFPAMHKGQIGWSGYQFKTYNQVIHIN